MLVIVMVLVIVINVGNSAAFFLVVVFSVIVFFFVGKTMPSAFFAQSSPFLFLWYVYHSQSWVFLVMGITRE